MFCLETLSAWDLLDRVTRTELKSGVLVWVPLTQDGCNPKVVERWVELVSQETDEEKRGDLAHLARVFAEWVGGFDVWNKPLESINMWKSKYLEDKRNENRLEGVRKGRQADLIRWIELRFPGESVADPKSLIEQTEDLDVLTRWVDVVVTKLKIDEVRAAFLADLPPTRN